MRVRSVSTGVLLTRMFIAQQPIMEDPSSLLVDYQPPCQIPYSPLISEEPLWDVCLAVIVATPAFDCTVIT